VRWNDATLALAEFVDYVGRILKAAGPEDEAFPWCQEDRAFERALAIDLVDFLRLGVGLSAAAIRDVFGVSSDEDLRHRLGLPPEAIPDDSVVLQALRDLELEAGIADTLLQCDLGTRSPPRKRFLASRWRALDATGVDFRPSLSPRFRNLQRATHMIFK
jgi:hypothetical protein